MSITQLTGYYISNLDNQIHNIKDVKHHIFEHGDWKEVSIVSEDGSELESCVLYSSLKDLIKALIK